MHLAELLACRPVPASALFMALTRRCPLRCRHCSTMSGPTAGQQAAAPLRRFAASFTAADHPEYLLLTGGEPLLRPGLVCTLAETARAAGTRSYLLTGAFFAERGRLPAPIRTALESVDHIAVSIDVFHEAEVPRDRVFRLLHQLLAMGRDASLQACGTGPDDPYLTGLTGDVRREFGDRVPMLVTTVRPAGRARAWLRAAGPPAGGPPVAEPPDSGPAAPDPPAAPCELLSWPVVAFDGTIAACCNQDVLDTRPVPAHLRLGHVSTSTWPEIRRACVSSAALRALRTRGPVQLAHRFAGPAGAAADPAAAAAGLGRPAAGYCATCRSLPARALRGAEAEAARPAARLIEQQAAALLRAAGPAGFARRHGDRSRADLVLLGYPGSPAGEARC
jgi:radical SAM family protein